LRTDGKETLGPNAKQLMGMLVNLCGLVFPLFTASESIATKLVRNGSVAFFISLLVSFASVPGVFSVSVFFCSLRPCCLYSVGSNLSIPRFQFPADLRLIARPEPVVDRHGGTKQ
jgi:hypothetical protein